MYRDYYKLGADPFRLTPDPGFVSAHQSYRSAQTRMLRALEQGDGILIVTGRPGTGKTTLIANFLSRLQPDKVLTASVVGTSLEGEGLLRMVGHAFGLDASHLDKAALLSALQDALAQRPRALLVIDEAQNLTAQALGDVHLLSSMQTGSRPLLQIFLVGQEQVHESLHTPDNQQLHQRITAACVLEPLSLQDTHDYVLHRLHCAGWRGNPAIVSDAFILIHRFSHGLPRYISKLCARLLEHGARRRRNNLNLDDVVTVIEEMQKEKLLPLHCEARADSGAPLPQMQDLVDSFALPMADRIQLTFDEQVFLEASPRVIQTTPAALVRAAEQDGQTVITIDTGPEDIVDTQEADAGPAVAESTTTSPVHIALEFCRGTGLQWLKSGARLIGVLVLRLLSWLRTMAIRSKALKPVAETLWRALCHYAGKALTVLRRTVTICSKHLAELLSGLGPRQTGAAGVALLLVISGAYFLIVTGDDQQPQASVPAEDRQTVSREISHEAVTEPSAKGEATQPDASPARPVIATPAQEEAVLQVARSEPSAETAAANNTGSARTDRYAAATPGTLEQKALANDGGVDASSESSAAEARGKLVDELLALAGRAMAQDRLRTPEGKNAWHYYSQVLVLDPQNRTALGGMQQIAARYHHLAASVMRKQEFDRADGFIRRGLSVVPDDSALLELRQEVQAQRSEMQAQQKQIALAALSESEPVSQAPAVDSQPKSGGLFGALKRVFKGDGDAINTRE